MVQENGSTAAKMSNASFTLRQVTLRNRSTEECFAIIQQAITMQEVSMIATPWVDENSTPYYWLGVRVAETEFDFKMPLNDEIEAFILAFMQGEELPAVSDFTSKTVDKAEWLKDHLRRYEPLAGKQKVKVEKSRTNGRDYLTKKLLFPKGKIRYSSLEISDIFSLIPQK